MTDSYIYEWQYSNGIPFYIGKGKGDRYLSLYGRNKFTNNVVEGLHNNGSDYITKITFNNLYEDEAFIIEKLLISYYGRRDTNTGILTNLTDGGEGMEGHIFSEESKIKMSTSHLGKKHSIKTKIKMSNSRRGIPILSLRGRKSYFFGKKHTEESIQKCKSNSPHKKAVIQFTKTGDYIKTFNSIREAERETGIRNDHIIGVCKGKGKTAGGFIWRYV